VAVVCAGVLALLVFGVLVATVFLFWKRSHSTSGGRNHTHIDLIQMPKSDLKKPHCIFFLKNHMITGVTAGYLVML